MNEDVTAAIQDVLHSFAAVEGAFWPYNVAVERGFIEKSNVVGQMPFVLAPMANHIAERADGRDSTDTLNHLRDSALHLAFLCMAALHTGKS